MDDDRRHERLRARCTTHLNWHGPRMPAGLLAELPDHIEGDVYGDGGVVTELETEVATLLGKPAAVFMPSGTMAQQIALRVHADQRGRRTVLMHPTAHPALHEDEALPRLHGLQVRPVGEAITPLTLDDLNDVAEDPAALLIELPQREIGGALPSWTELIAQCDWARDRGAAVHMDGARLWESGPFYGRSYADIAAPFDSVYVSMYKGLGGIAGACLAGEEDLIAQAREWRHRHGGTVWALWPYAASALACLRLRLDRMPAYVDHARAIADALRDRDGIEVTVDPPHTNMLHISMRTTLAGFRAQAIRIAATEGTWTWARSWPTDRPAWQQVELSIGDAGLELEPDRVADLFSQLITPPPTAPADQFVEVVDDEGAVTDVVARQQVRAEGLRHRCTYVVVMTADQEVVVHQRADFKDVYPGWWDLAFGGICDVGEGWEDAAARELAEEAGLVGAHLEDLGEVSWSSADAALVGRVYLAHHDGELSCPDGEVVALDRVPLSDLAGWIDAHQVCEDSRDAVAPLLHRLA